MLQGGSVADNDDPSVTEPAAGAEWQIDPPHVMIVSPEPLDRPVFHRYHAGGPWVMCGGTPFEHIMVPLTDPVHALGHALYYCDGNSRTLVNSLNSMGRCHSPCWLFMPTFPVSASVLGGAVRWVGVKRVKGGTRIAAILPQHLQPGAIDGDVVEWP